MDKVEERLKTHNEKLMQTITKQKEAREKRRRSFHEVIFIKKKFYSIINFLFFCNIFFIN